MVDADKFAKELNLSVLSPSTVKQWDIESAEFNRPGLELVGFYEHFAFNRPQVFGNVEMTYLSSLTAQEREQRLRKFFSYPIPCVIVCRGYVPPADFLQYASERNVVVYSTREPTTKFIVEAILYLNKALAPQTTMHAVLVDVYGVGVLITGESGVGKSESALELVKRGHQLVADDVVDIKRVADNRIIGESPATVRHFMELRGIGIIDVRQMFGVGSVLLNKAIDMQIHLENWVEKKEYDRLGLEEEYTEILGVKVPHLVIPVRPGRNLSIIIEVAARNLSLKKMGYSAAHELDKRLNEMMLRNQKERGKKGI
ncbi:MAG: HPr(Ser) kinase/phosphatase [Eubacteriales bacterium]|nr:HPr(Ser) kinase/phosphatase [Eubacteriales bacterium]